MDKPVCDHKISSQNQPDEPIREWCYMLTHSALIAFIATTLPEQAKAFYTEALGMTLVDDTPFALVYNANGTMLRIQKVQAHTPASHTVLGWQVSNIREAVEKLLRCGITCERYAGLSQDEQGIWTTPDGNRIAWFCDPDGNVLSFTEFQ